MTPHLAHPEWMAPLGGLMLISTLGLAVAHATARRRARRLLGPGGARIVEGRSRDATLLLALLVVSIGLLGPELGARTVWVDSSGVDLVALLDVSPSMLAQDVPPSRLARAREAAREVLERLAPGDRAALAAFSGRGVLLTPLTPDKSALVAMLPALDPELMQERGSRIGVGLRAALDAFEGHHRRPGIVLVLSDGEDPGREDVPTQLAVRTGARVIAATFGTESGATVPARGAPLRDAGGRVVVSRREPEPLRSLTERTGGILFQADRWGALDADALVRAIRRDAGRAPGELVPRRLRVAWVTPFAGLAFLVLAFDLAFSGTGVRRRPSARVLALAVVASWSSAAAGIGPRLVAEIEARVRAEPEDARALVVLGVARAELGEPDEAARAFFAAAARARDPNLAALAYYDLGVTEIARGRLEPARDAFYDALAFRPDDFQAKFNLEWTLRALRSAPAPDPGQAADAAKSDPASTSPVDATQSPARSRDERSAKDREPERDPGRSNANRSQFASELTPEEVERWLEEVPDDARHSLRDAARRASAGKPRLPRSVPRW